MCRSKTLSLKLRIYLNGKQTETKVSNDLVLFFPEKDLSLRDIRDKNYKEIIGLKPTAGLSRLLSALKSCRQSLDVCIYSIAYKPFIQIIRDLSRNGINVRLILNGRNTGEDGRKVQRASKKMDDLKNSGVRIRVICLPNESAYMHNKFVVIDSKILINGSLNWTKNAIFESYNDIVITSDENLVETYSQAFTKLWTEY